MSNWLLVQILALLQQHPVLFFSFVFFLVASQWALFAKAGQPGWAVLIPIYGQVVHARVAGHPWWVGLLLFVPVLNLFGYFALSMGVAKRFGKSPLFGLGLLFASPIFTPMLAFGRARYRLYA